MTKPSKKADKKTATKLRLSPPRLKSRFFQLAALLGIVIGIAIIIYPFIPYLKYKFFPPSQEASASLDQSSSGRSGLLSYLPLIGDNDESQSGNRLIIPKIGVNARIAEGENDKALLKGAWRIPQSSTPNQGGNTVITGHRFRFLPPNNTTFYLLDKIGIGDEITIIWEDKEYYYQVKETKIVNPEQTEIAIPSDEPIITLYTCTPLFTTRQRLVVVGELI